MAYDYIPPQRRSVGSGSVSESETQAYLNSTLPTGAPQQFLSQQRRPVGSGSTSDAEIQAYKRAVGIGDVGIGVADAGEPAYRNYLDNLSAVNPQIFSGTTSDAEMAAYRQPATRPVGSGSTSDAEMAAYRAAVGQPQVQSGSMSGREQQAYNTYLKERQRLEQGGDLAKKGALYTPTQDPYQQSARRAQFGYQGNPPPQGAAGAGMDFPTATTGVVPMPQPMAVPVQSINDLDDFFINLYGKLQSP